MLQSIRDRLSGPIVWFVIGLICIPFAFWGVQSFKGDAEQAVVAKVGDHEITEAEFRQGYDQRYQQLVAMLGDAFKPEMVDQTRFRQNVLDDLVQEQVMRQYTHQAGYRASDAAVFNYLSNVPAFQKDGKFSADLYRELLAARGMQPQRFENQLRESLVVDQLRDTVSRSAFVSDEEARLTRRIAAQRRDIGVAVLPLANYEAGVTVSDAQVSERYEQKKDGYQAPERLKLAYVELDLDKLPKGAQPGPEALKAVYDAEKDTRFTGTEERRARHILISFGADKSASKEKARKLADELKKGGDFAALARQNSDDTGSKAQGGELGWVKRGMMVKSFEDALFSLSPNEISSPVETEFGWHVVQLEELKTPAARPFDDPGVQAELAELYQARDAKKRFQDETEKLEQLAFENPASLDAAAKALSLKVETTDWLTRESSTGLLAQEPVKQAAFSNEVLKDGENSKPLALGSNRVVVVRKSEYEPPRQRPLAEVADAIRAELKHEGAKDAAQAAAKTMVANLRKGDSLEAAVASAHGDIRQNGPVSRSEPKPELGVVEAAFKLPRPADGKVVVGQAAFANGDPAVILLRKVEDADAGAIAGADQGQLREAVAGAEYAAVRKSLESAIKVDIRKQPAADPAGAPAEGG